MFIHEMTDHFSRLFLSIKIEDSFGFSLIFCLWKKGKKLSSEKSQNYKPVNSVYKVLPSLHAIFQAVS